MTLSLRSAHSFSYPTTYNQTDANRRNSSLISSIDHIERPLTSIALQTAWQTFPPFVPLLVSPSIYLYLVLEMTSSSLPRAVRARSKTSFALDASGPPNKPPDPCVPRGKISLAAITTRSLRASIFQYPCPRMHTTELTIYGCSHAVVLTIYYCGPLPWALSSYHCMIPQTDTYRSNVSHCTDARKDREPKLNSRNNQRDRTTRRGSAQRSTPPPAINGYRHVVALPRLTNLIKAEHDTTSVDTYCSTRVLSNARSRRDNVMDT